MTGQSNIAKSYTRLALLCLAALGTFAAYGEEADKPPADDLWTRKWMLGDWGGERKALEDQGLSFRLNYTQYLHSIWSGGRDTENGHDFAGDYALTILANFGKMEGLKESPFMQDLEFFIRARGRWGGNPGDFDVDKVGGLHRINFGVSGSNEEIYVDRWWFRKRLFENHLELRLGKLAALADNSNYAGSAVTQFMNRALSDNVLIPGEYGHGVAAKLWLTERLFVSGAVYDNETHPFTLGFETPYQSPAEYRAIWEVSALPEFETDKGPLNGNYRIGGWFLPHDRNIYFDRLGGRLAARTRDDDVGFYLGADQLVWKENAEPKDKQGLALFAKYAYAHADINFIEHYWALGGQYEGLIPGRDKDVLGFGVAQSVVSSDYRHEIDGTFDRETVYELYYRIQLTPWLEFSPDFQFINQPGGNQDDRDAFVAGLRLRVTF